jgi:hypothetical protein
MKTVRIKIDPAMVKLKPVGRINAAKLDATTEADIATHTEDEVRAILECGLTD